MFNLIHMLKKSDFISVVTTVCEKLEAVEFLLNV